MDLPSRFYCAQDYPELKGIMAHRSESRGGICHNTCEIIFICLSGKHAHPQLYLQRDHGRVVGPRPVCAGRHHGLDPAGINNMRCQLRVRTGNARREHVESASHSIAGISLRRGEQPVRAIGALSMNEEACVPVLRRTVPRALTSLGQVTLHRVRDTRACGPSFETPAFAALRRAPQDEGGEAHSVRLTRCRTNSAG